MLLFLSFADYRKYVYCINNASSQSLLNTIVFFIAVSLHSSTSAGANYKGMLLNYSYYSYKCLKKSESTWMMQEWYLCIIFYILYNIILLLQAKIRIFLRDTRQVKMIAYSQL